MRHCLIPIVYGVIWCVVGMLVHTPRRQNRTLQAFIDAIAFSGLSVKEVACALGYDLSQFNKILRGAESHKLDIERFEGRLPYAVAKLFIPKLAEIALSAHMQQSADVLTDNERAS